MKKALSLLLVLIALLSLLPLSALAAASNPYSGKVISILGDSISTYEGYIPTYDGFNLEHHARYPDKELLTGVNNTWWMQVINRLDAKLGINESWRSTEVGNVFNVTVNKGYDGTKACMASTTRIQNLGANGTPDVILFYGGTNDILKRRAVGFFDPATAPAQVDLTTNVWDTVAEAYVTAIMRMQYYYPDAKIVAMLPTYTEKNTDKVLEKYNSVFAAICEHYGVTYVDLRECGITTSNLPDGTHPDAKGMDYITEAVLEVLDADDVCPGEHIVHSVTHKLTHVQSSLSYYKGISHGSSYTAQLSGKNLKVSVTMDGQDITASSYKNGQITVGCVTGDLVITASGTGGTVYSDRLQQLPNKFCKSLNLWDVLGHDEGYFKGKTWQDSFYSVTIPVKAGQKIWATSFQKKGTNRGTKNGIRITWFDEDGVLKTVSPADVYAEFAKKGYITVPKGAVAVNIPMWDNSSSNKLYIKSNGHRYDCGKCMSCGNTLSYYSHLQQLPAPVCCDTNLWSKLKPESGYYDGSAWSTSFYSVTVPVNAGDKIWATSFQKKNTNGGSKNGIRITWFDDDGVLKTVSPADVYAEFAKKGYITVPKGAVAVNIPMWNNKSGNKIYILNRGHYISCNSCLACGAAAAQ